MLGRSFGSLRSPPPWGGFLLPRCPPAPSSGAPSGEPPHAPRSFGVPRGEGDGGPGNGGGAPAGGCLPGAAALDGKGRKSGESPRGGQRQGAGGGTDASVPRVRGPLFLESEALRGAPKLPLPHKGGCCRLGVPKRQARGFPCQARRRGGKSIAVASLWGCGRRGAFTDVSPAVPRRPVPLGMPGAPPLLRKCRQAARPSLPAGQRGTLTGHARRGNGAGDASGHPPTPPHPSGLPGHPNPLDQSTSACPRRCPLQSRVQRKPRAGPGGSHPPLLPPPATHVGKTRRIWPTACQKGGGRGARAVGREPAPPGLPASSPPPRGNETRRCLPPARPSRGRTDAPGSPGVVGSR